MFCNYGCPLLKLLTINRIFDVFVIEEFIPTWWFQKFVRL